VYKKAAHVAGRLRGGVAVHELTGLTEHDRIKRCPKHMLDRRVSKCDDDIWPRIKSGFAPTHIFVNIPYVAEYRPLQAAIVATLLKVGLRPHLASFKSEGRPLRICKICEMMQTSKYALTDLSFANLHNMPFELGYFLALGRLGHSFILMDAKYITNAKGHEVRKFDSQLSNLKGVEVIVHDKNPRRLVVELLKRIKNDVPEAAEYVERGTLIKEIMRYTKTVERALERGTLDEFVERAYVLFRSLSAKKRPK
jgi:hypothetical protein